MQTSAFDFDLPPELVALRPATPRESARLLVVHSDGHCEHRSFGDLPGLLRKGDVLAFNDSKVIHARLLGRRPARSSGGPDVEVDVTLHKRISANRYLAFAQPAKRLRAGDRLGFSTGLGAHVARRDAGEVELTFDREGTALDHAIAEAGVMPLPPYIARRRAPDARDEIDYQTVYAAHEGSVAAPTAGLHFTASMLEKIKKSEIDSVYLTLHVGAGTFLPVAADDIRDHVMHAEHAILSDDAAIRLNAAHAAGGRIAAVGTTALRTLESAADETGTIQPFDSDTRIFIAPGYRFKTVDILLTNFHLPCSTLFMLVCAFSGTETMKRAYAEAIRKGYRFYSYGDACLLFRPR